MIHFIGNTESNKVHNNDLNKYLCYSYIIVMKQHITMLDNFFKKNYFDVSTLFDLNTLVKL